MIDSSALLADLKQQLKLLQEDLRQRAEDPDDAWGRRLREQHTQALTRGRTGHAWLEWRDNEVDQAAVAWLVATTFVRFCEDNDLLAGARDQQGREVPTLWLAGPGERLSRAVEHETQFFVDNPSANRRDWLQVAFGVLAAQPAGRALVDPRHSLVWQAEISAEAADRLVAFWRATDAAGALVHDFTDPDLNTRFLGDLYQDLSEHAKKTYALLQTPEFVEEFILDQTLTPAIEEFGLDGLRIIDPTCGSGHFLLGAFTRLNQRWAEQAPGLDVRSRVQKTMDSIHGVDLNPFAVAIARFRLTVAGLQAAGLRSLVEAPAWGFHLAVGDSLLAGQGIQGELNLEGDQPEELFEYDEEDVSEYRGILEPGRYHVVVGNPPYITVKDKALNQAYRAAYPTCAGKYALSVPFLELFFRLTIKGYPGQAAGYCGQITSNSFMKREFGKKVIADLLSGNDPSNPVDLTHVIDTSGAYIPGHGTPTVILLGRRRRPQADTVRAVLGVRGEPGQPADPAKGLVWTEIVDHLDQLHYDGDYVTVTDLGRANLASHPWSLSGGGASEAFEALEKSATHRLQSLLSMDIGFASFPGNDEPFFLGEGWFRRFHDAKPLARELIVGEVVRDWVVRPDEMALVPYDSAQCPASLDGHSTWGRHLWRFRRVLQGTTGFAGQTRAEAGEDWWTWYRWVRERYLTPLSLTFAFVATHNHFVLDRGGKVFKQSAPVIKLSESATEQDHLDLLGVLNSSTACFWLKQVSYPKGGDPMGQDGARVSAESWSDRYEFTGTKLQEFPLPGRLPGERGRLLDCLAQELAEHSPKATLSSASTDVRGRLVTAEDESARLRARMIFEQEELDWEVYRLYGLVDEDLTYAGSWPMEERQLVLGERAFEIALARRVAEGTEETTWFERHGSTPITELPAHWPADYRQLVERRLELIASDRFIGLLERPEFKRRWAGPGWDALQREALTEAVLDRLEDRGLWFDANGLPVTRSVAELADVVRHDEFLRQCAELLASMEDPDLTEVLVDLVKDQLVPYLAALRYKPSGVEKYREWQRVWELQRREDAGEKVTIPVPPKYASADFSKTSYWRARGKLDVPKERFICYPGVARAGDATPVIGWAGWDHAQQAQALAREIGVQQGLGADRDQLMPLVAGLVELEPWLDQWHHEIDPRYGTSPAAAIRQSVEHYLAMLNVTRDNLNAWRPPAPTRGRKPRTTSTDPEQ